MQTMQISRHWRLNAQRYRLEGFRSANGSLSLRPRPLINEQKQADVETESQSQEKLLVLSY